MSRSLKIVLVLVGLVGSLLLLLWIDDDLSDESKQLIATVEQQAASSTYEAYQYLFGIAARAETNPIDQSIQDLAQADQVDATEKHADELFFPSRSAPLYCALKEAGCFEQIMSQSHQWRHELAENRVLLQRYETFLRFEEFATPLKALSISHPLPEYTYLVRANRLKLLAALVAAEESGGDAGIAVLMEDLNQLRPQLKNTDALVHKMVFVALMANDLDALVHVFKHYPPRHAYSLVPLSPTELHIDKPLTREFYSVYKTYLEFDENYDAFSQTKLVPHGLFKFAYKLNVSINDLAHRFNVVMRLAQTSSEQFALEVSQPNFSLLETGFKWTQIRNVIGFVLGQVSGPGYENFIARPHDLNVKLLLTQYVLNRQSEMPANPYGNSYATKQTDRSICMDGPLKDERNLRCVSW